MTESARCDVASSTLFLLASSPVEAIMLPGIEFPVLNTLIFLDWKNWKKKCAFLALWLKSETCWCFILSFSIRIFHLQTVMLQNEEAKVSTASLKLDFYHWLQKEQLQPTLSAFESPIHVCSANANKPSALSDTEINFSMMHHRWFQRSLHPRWIFLRWLWSLRILCTVFILTYQAAWISWRPCKCSHFYKFLLGFRKLKRNLEGRCKLSLLE